MFETFFDHLAELSSSAHLVQMFDSTIVRAHVSADCAKGAEGQTLGRSRSAFDMHSGPLTVKLDALGLRPRRPRALVGFMSEQTSGDFQLHIGEKFESRLE
ncbi:hypothetical protein HED49_23275 [Ochrobactrum daejeonense]|nr:hypothetical protein [Brucella daejeonensis]